MKLQYEFMPLVFVEVIVSTILRSEVIVVHYYAHGKNGPFDVKGPIILGHESAGEVVAVGPSTRDLKPGISTSIQSDST